jgi:hypothetical protein
MRHVVVDAERALAAGVLNALVHSARVIEKKLARGDVKQERREPGQVSE